MSGSFREAELAGWTSRADSYDSLFMPVSNQAIPAILAALGDLRAAMLIEAQTKARRAVIHDAILAAARAHTVGDTIVISRPTVLVCGTKPVK
jgi:hypothetical protein